MTFTAWADAKVKRLDWLDIALVKLAMLFFALLVARRWRGVLKPHPGWYALGFLLAAARPLWRACLKGEGGDHRATPAAGG